MSLELLLSPAPFGSRVLRVDPTGASGYSTLSSALAAITDASTTNEYLIIVAGEIAETAAIAAKSHVNVVFLAGASVTVTSTSTLNAVNMTSITNSVWATVDPSKPHIIRAGAVSGGAHVLSTSSLGNTVRLSGLNALNSTTGGANCHGIYNSVSSPTMTNCTGVGGGGATCYGIVNEVSSPIMTNCTGVGGGGATCYGIYNFDGSNPVMTTCTGTGGAGGTACYGIYNSSSSPTMTDCTGTGGGGGTTCYGIYNSSSSPTMTDCTGTGGGGGTDCHGILNNASSSPTMTDCTGTGGGGAVACHGILNNASSSPTMTDCTGTGGGVPIKSTTATIPATTRQDDSFRPSATIPYRLLVASINVTAAAAAGVTLTLRDATGGVGNALSGTIAVDSSGVKTFPVTGNRVIATAGYIYGRLSASDSALAYTVTYSYETCFTSCNALYQDTDSPCDILDPQFVSNAASDATIVTANGILRTVFDGGSARSGRNDGTRMKAMNCVAAWNPGQVYNMVLDGGSTNLTAAVGVANGSNIER